MKSERSTRGEIVNGVSSGKRAGVAHRDDIADDVAGYMGNQLAHGNIIAHHRRAGWSRIGLLHPAVSARLLYVRR